eukprot:CAMPEP_0197319298 /NCGR_PEP_ID=MMETSP0891-20130614/54179_1 /TAXON_ID=44058 ORGANISM="Aureoumbra lagunensis, Strain CCMP1510" /NCGR_SAMPLE_ID=MMETSP0891 /ASSEMBLY_ACC=CAM_ASM_000534 /LENGTH=364 /DNA_ID=CAMNT_0042810159 /DNA_START=21 /DNA_END=1115 /DNA_ORIENTATION=+
MLIIRVRHSGGTFRVSLEEDATLGLLREKVKEKIGNDVALSLDPAGSQPLEPTSELITMLGLEHGTMVHVQPVVKEEEVSVNTRISIPTSPPVETTPEPTVAEPATRQFGGGYDAEMEEAIAIARAADAAEAEAPRAPDSTIREALVGPRAQIVQDDADIARLIAEHDLENHRAQIATSRLFPSDEGLRGGGRRAQHRRRREREDFSLGFDGIPPDADDEVDDDVAPIPLTNTHLSTEIQAGANDDDDAALQAAILASATEQSISTSHEVDDGELARALAMSMAQQESPATEPSIPQQNQGISNDFRLDESDEIDPDLQSALLGATHDFRDYTQRQRAEEEELEKAIALSKLEAKKHFGSSSPP